MRLRKPGELLPLIVRAVPKLELPILPSSVLPHPFCSFSQRNLKEEVNLCLEEFLP